jgi:hypothetical protein
MRRAIITLAMLAMAGTAWAEDDGTTTTTLPPKPDPAAECRAILRQIAETDAIRAGQLFQISGQKQPVKE